MGAIGIRMRLAAVSALLAGGVLVATMSAVFLIERNAAETSLHARATAAVLALQDAAVRAGDDGVTPYLAARAGADELLSMSNAGGVAVNRPGAAALRSLPAGRVSIGGRGYIVARIARGKLVAIAAVPTFEADREQANLLHSILEIGAAGLVLTLELAWFAAHRALRPLEQMADRAAEVTAGDPGARVGSAARRRDEIGRLGVAIDAMLERLDAAYVAQRRFVQDASHELRTPLTIARGHLEVLLLDPDPPVDETRHAVTLAVAELDRVGRLISALLGLARLEDGAIDPVRPVPVEALLSDAAARGRGLGDRAFTVAVEPPGLTVEADPEALAGVLLNLVSNAVRHTAAGGRIALTAHADGDDVELAVLDDGPGIPPELLPVIFDRFARADPARSRATGGTGLGLAICRAVVEAHGGTIAASSGPAGGATFTVRLPVARTSPREPVAVAL
jgi:signal transduction histidine kinase